MLFWWWAMGVRGARTIGWSRTLGVITGETMDLPKLWEGEIAMQLSMYVSNLYSQITYSQITHIYQIYLLQLGCGSASCRYTGSPDTAPTTPKPKPVPLALYCDLSHSQYYSQYHPINGSYNLRTTNAKTGKTYTAEVRCKNSMCTPQRQGPVNACMYICGETKCWSSPI